MLQGLAVQNNISIERFQTNRQQPILKMDDLKAEMLVELQRILCIMRSLNISKQNTDAGTANQNEPQITIRLAPPPSQTVDENLKQSLEVFEGYFEGEPKFRRLLEQKGLFATTVSSVGLNCFIYSLLQHAKQQYSISQFEPVLVDQIKTKAGLSQQAEMRYNDTPETLAILKAVNEICGVNLEVHFIQISSGGQPIILSPLLDETLQSQKQSVVIWQQPGHYVAIASIKLAQLCGLRFVDDKTEQEDIKVKTEPAIVDNLPRIPYDRQILQRIINELSLSQEIVLKVTAYIDSIEHQVSEIKNYQSKKNLKNFYAAIGTAVLEIQNIANSFYELIKPYHPKLPYTLKQKIVQWTRPLEIALKHLTLSAIERTALALTTKHLYAEQSFILRDPLVKETFIQHLEKLKAILLDSNKPLPCCYISYAWSSQEYSDEEYWVQPFLYILYDHLTASGIRVVMDIRDNKPDDSLYPFIQQYQDGNYVILIGTESLLQKHYSSVPNILQTQLNTLLQKMEQDQRQFGESRLYPLLISGDLKTTYPEYYQQYSTIKDAREMGYLGTLQALIDWIYKSRLEAIRQPYLELWRTFTDTYPNLAKTPSAIQGELNFSYHQKYLHYLKQTVQYQSVAAQESTQYIEATELRMIDTLRESQGTNPKTLFDGHGQQFQRPSLNVDFTERSDFDMRNDFIQQSQRYLILQGAEGVGKTELVKYYFLHPPKPYTLRAWFYTSSQVSLYSQYTALAVNNGIQFASDMPIEEKIKCVRQWLEQQDCLLVYDNVPESETLEQLIPEQGKHHIIVTTRTPLYWSQVYQTLSVKALQEREAIDLVCRITNYSPEQFFLKELVYHLKLLPSKLVQAGNYMRAKSVNSYQYWLRYQRHQEYLNSIPKHVETDFQRNSSSVTEVPEFVKSIDDTAYPEDLTELSYDRKVLEEMVANLSVPQKVTERVSTCFNHIEQRISNIRQYRAKKNFENFYQLILAALQEIRNIANEIYTLIECYHPNFPSLIKTRIIEKIVPLETELRRRLETNQREQNVFQSKRLCAEQSFVSRQSALMLHLEKLKLLLAKQNVPILRCYICYAWPFSNPEEDWIQPFLSTLYDHLKALGIVVMMDIRDVRLGESVYEFMKQYQAGNYLILVGTESLLQKHHSLSLQSLQTALNIALSRSGINQMQFGESRIYPLLISGTIKTAYPERYRLYLRVQDARETGYLGTLRQLIEWMYGQYLAPIQPEVRILWRTLYEVYSSLPQEPSEVEKELSSGYHQQCLGNLRKDGDYQGVEAQEKTPHSSAVQAEMISTWMKSKGSNSQPLLDESGQQFQRPYDNPDFIERPKLWKKMTQHFATAEHQILTLTAHGLGGMGKTELAGRYYLHPLKVYALRAWFDASSNESLFLQYVDLAESNGMQFIKDMPIEEKVARVKKWLEEKKDCLLIYDNVPNVESIMKWLPKQGKHHILITSRNAVDWPTHQKLDVDVMEEEEAIALIYKVTGYNSDEPRLKELVHILGLLPLALTQAAAYMKVKDKSISEYLLEYQQSQSSLETSNINPKHEPVWVTFNMNFTSLQQECPAALMTLKQASWLSDRAIPEVLLFLMTDNIDARPKELVWDDVKEHVRRYSLMRINVEDLQLSIHPLLQDIIRSQQTFQEQLQQFRECSDALSTLEKPCYEHNLIIYRALFPHAERLYAHAKQVAIRVKDDKKHDFLIMETASLEMFYLRLSLNQQALGFLTEKISIQEKHYGKDHLKTARLLANLGNVYREQGKFEKANECYQRSLKINQQHHGEEDIRTAMVLGGLGNVYQQQGKLEDARDCYERALRIEERHYGKDHLEMASNLGGLGNIYQQQGRFEQAREYYERALKLKERRYCKDHVEITAELGNLGTIYYKQGKLKEAKEYYERTLKIQEQHYGKDHVQTTASLGNLGTVYLDEGKLEQAKQYYERALSLQEHHYGKEHVGIVAVLGNLGNIYRRQGKSGQASQYYERALKIKDHYYGKDHPQIASELVNLGHIYREQGKLEQASEYYNKALAIEESYYGKNHVETTAALASLGNLYLGRGKLEKANEHYQRALRVQECHYGRNHLETTVSLENIGMIYQKRGEFEQAKVYYERALNIEECHYGKDHVQTRTVLANLGTVYAEQGDLEQAQKYYERVLIIEENHYGKDHVETATVLGHLGVIYFQQRNFEKGKEHCERALRIQERHYGKDRVETATELGNLGNIYFQQGEVEQAREHYERVLVIQEKHYGKDHVETATVLGNLGNIYQIEGELGKAKTYFERTLKIQEDHYGKDCIGMENTLIGLGILYQKFKEFKDAIQYLQRAQTICYQHFLPNHPNVLKVEQALKEVKLELSSIDTQSSKTDSNAEMRNVFMLKLKSLSFKFNKEGVAYFQAKEYTNALSCFEKALKLQQQISNIPNEEIATLHYNIGTIYFFQNNYAFSVVSLQSAYDIRLVLLGDLHAATKKAENRLKECQSAIVKIDILSNEVIVQNNTEFSAGVVLQNEVQAQSKGVSLTGTFGF